MNHLVPPSTSAPQVDVFCRVVDNFGDIGVCWRLARHLRQRWAGAVRLWVDDLASFARIQPGLDARRDQQTISGVTVYRWHATAHWPAPASCVIETFGCDLPDAYLQQLGPDTVWLNLEYLSAEDWVDGCHGLPSPQPGGQHKRFVFPGFRASTGGLLRESNLQHERDAWQTAPAQRSAWWSEHGLPAELTHQILNGQRRVLTAFVYADAPLSALYQALHQSPYAWLVVLAGERQPPPGVAAFHPKVSSHSLPFLAQQDYDRLLWSADWNLVRGEDSFVRAQLARRPLLWHIYPQAEAAHQVKLDAWLRASRAPPSLQAVHHFWNGTSDATRAATLDALAQPATLAEWQDWADDWCAELFRLPELGESLLEFCRPGLQSTVVAKHQTHQDIL